MNESTSRDYGLLLLRSVPPLLLIVFHGWGKLVSAISHFAKGTEWKFIESVGTLGFPFPTFFATCAALAESVVCLFLMIGLFTRYAAAIIAFNFVVAVYRHASTDMKFELAGLYLILGLTFLLTGPGRFSLDSRRMQKR